MARALARARSRVTAVNALSALLRSAMRASAASTTATALRLAGGDGGCDLGG